MTPKLFFNNFSVVVTGQNHNPTVLNPDFLKINKIVPSEWELASPPICVEPMSQVVFKNRVKITAQIDRIIFEETIEREQPIRLFTPEIAQKYTKVLPHVEYTAVGLNPKGHIDLGGKKTSRKKFLVDKFIKKGPWQDFENSPVSPALKFAYNIEDTTFSLTIEEKVFRERDKEPIPIIFLGGNFHYRLSGEDRKSRLAVLHKIIKNATKDVKQYKKFVSLIVS